MEDNPLAQAEDALWNNLLLLDFNPEISMSQFGLQPSRTMFRVSNMRGMEIVFHHIMLRILGREETRKVRR